MNTDILPPISMNRDCWTVLDVNNPCNVEVYRGLHYHAHENVSNVQKDNLNLTTD